MENVNREERSRRVEVEASEQIDRASNPRRSVGAFREYVSPRRHRGMFFN